ncbi:MAG: nucleotidyltransferase domain-containing protein [Acidimicrobiales bacterium]|nr:nucleotidyltransferase domain-containing protein [Acidimicrobiales bacterium]
MAVVISRGAEQRAALLAELHRLTARLRTLPGVIEVWLFGSLVSGHVHGGSDLDLLVVRDTAEPPTERIATLWRELAPRVAVDLFVYTPAEAAEGGRFVDDARRRGRRII